MKKITLSILTVALTTAVWAHPLDRSIKPKPGPAPEVKLGKAEQFTLPNGLRVFIVENHKLPTIACSIELDVKPALEGDMAGYRDMMDELLLSGTTTRSKDKLNEEIDFMGASIRVSDLGMSGSSLKKYQEKLLDLMADIAMNSQIKQEELDIVKKKTLSSLQTTKNEPDAMVRNVSAVVNFGKNHPYGEVTTEETVKNITLDRCNQYYHTYFRPNVAYMAIVGDITLAEVKPLIEKYFSQWQKQDVPVATYTIPDPAAKLTKVDFAPRTAAVQSVVSVTYSVDLKPGSPDLIKARVANTVLGGGSQGRLFLDLREKHAWTYGAYSNIKDDELGGTFAATVKCRNVVSDSSIGAILDEMHMMQTERVNDTALQNSITYLSGNFAIGLEDPKRIAQFAINIERYHMPEDFYRNYLKNLAAVTSDDVMAVSRKYIQTEHANIVVAGSKDEVAGKLAKFSADGKIDYYDYSGKPIAVAEPMAVPAGITADGVYKKYVLALGGEKAISAIKDIKVIGNVESHGTIVIITAMKKAPNKWKQTAAVPANGKMTIITSQAYNGKSGYMEMQGNKQPIEGDDLADVAAQADIYAELHQEKYGNKRTIKGVEAVNGNSAYVIEMVNSRGKKTMEYYDVNSGLLLKKFEAEGERQQTTEYSDYREVPGANGYKVPYKITQTSGGRSNIEIVRTVEINKGIADSEFN